MNHIRAILFDIDGTLLDTTEFILQAAEYALKVHNLPIPDRKVIRLAVGLPVNEYFRTFAGDFDPAILLQTVSEFQLQNMHLSFPYENALSTLQTLKNKGLKVGAVTSRRRESILQTLEPTKITELLDVLVAGGETALGKPHADPLLKAVELLNEHPDTAFMVGDSHFDIAMGKSAGTKTIRAMYGFHTEFLHEPEPDFFVEDIGDLLKIL